MAEALNQFHFLRPLWFWAVVPALIISWLCWHTLRNSDSWKKVISPELLPHLMDQQHNTVKRSPAGILLISWLIALLALAGPSWEKQNLPVHQRLDALVIVFDLSLSMYAEDIKPSRLTRARHKLLDILDQRKEGVTALIAYAGDAHIVSPLTDDNATIANLLPALTPAIMPMPGNEPVIAIETALSLFKSAAINRGKILLVTDEINEDDANSVSDLINAKKYSLSILGVGTDEGAPIPMNNGELLRDRQGAIVIPKLSRRTLQHLANKTSGQYTDLSWDDSDIATLLSEDFSETLTNTISRDRQAEQWHDAGYWLVLLLIPIALLAFRQGWLLVVLPLLFLPVENSHAFEWQDLWYTKDQQGARAMESGASGQAAELFRQKAWSGAANYRANQFEQASDAFSVGKKADDYYNLGNALAQQSDFPKALDAYDKALELDPLMEDAKFNRKLLEKLQQQQDQNQENKNQQQNGDQNAEQKPPQQQNDPQAGHSDQEQQNSEGKQEQQQNRNQNENQKKSNQQKPEVSPEQKEAQKSPNQADNSPGEETKEKPGNEQKKISSQAQSEEQEKQQATEQWLRRVPDDPSGLLRRKFEYESKNKNRDDNDKNYW